MATIGGKELVKAPIAFDTNHVDIGNIPTQNLAWRATLVGMDSTIGASASYSTCYGYHNSIDTAAGAHSMAVGSNLTLPASSSSSIVVGVGSTLCVAQYPNLVIGKSIALTTSTGGGYNVVVGISMPTGGVTIGGLRNVMIGYNLWVDPTVTDSVCIGQFNTTGSAASQIRQNSQGVAIMGRILANSSGVAVGGYINSYNLGATALGASATIGAGAVGTPSRFPIAIGQDAPANAHECIIGDSAHHLTNDSDVNVFRVEGYSALAGGGTAWPIQALATPAANDQTGLTVAFRSSAGVVSNKVLKAVPLASLPGGSLVVYMDP